MTIDVENAKTRSQIDKEVLLEMMKNDGVGLVNHLVEKSLAEMYASLFDEMDALPPVFDSVGWSLAWMRDIFSLIRYAVMCVTVLWSGVVFRTSYTT